MEFKNVHTRFRAYQLSTAGSSFSYWDANSNKFVLGEARYNDDNIASIKHELYKCNKTKIDELYISSWDADHCSSQELERILNELKPSSIYYPRYKPDPTKQNQVESKSLIDSYNGPPTLYKSDGTGFEQAIPWDYNKVFYTQPLTGVPNDDSLICLWRCGNFSVLSVGDLESSTLSQIISADEFLKEVDVLILPHHGSSRDFTTDEFIKALNPQVCLALVDRQNQYGHPDSIVYQRVNNNSWYYSTKDGDVIIETNGDLNEYFSIFNYRSDGNILYTIKTFACKKTTQNNIDFLNTIINR